ncbi:capsid assembly scaffolding protein Gp46 family protein [Streptococcus danieliae]|uniref:DUF4355 domain-containing protein n=1 Tax=Streptococcus danieliae TaxID=747656 RepID=A0A7Z0M658_9STRE|nr:DUF4355 domain-containing protein [Streptococcus danieliae]MBF0699433.1 DUF4355 domain-containing protein [Streptococcus danieliae]NYS96609.1 DUF4355 domain-containing protein [Streptococcus danieliae]
MAEEKENPAVDPETDSQVKEQDSNPNSETEKTVSVAEMQRRLKLAEDKHQVELANLKADVQKQIDDAVAQAKMSDEELQALKEKEKQEAIQAIQEENADLKAQIAQRQMQDIAIKELEAQGVPVNESTLAFVVKDDEEATKLAVTNMANILNIQKREEAKSDPPKTSGGDDGGAKRGKDKFANAKITSF